MVIIVNLLDTAISHVFETARIPSFSSYEEAMHPYIRKCFSSIEHARSIDVPGNSLIYYLPGTGNKHKRVALAVHLDKINHYGELHPTELPVRILGDEIEGAMDDCAGLGILLAIAERASEYEHPDLLFFFSEMEESKGLKEHPELLRNNGVDYECGLGARRIASTCLQLDLIPDEVITIDTTPLFKGKPGVAIYSRHWEYNKLKPSASLIARTETLVHTLREIDPEIYPSNNTNDYLEYGLVFNESGKYCVPSIALEPAIFPYHQKRERVYIEDIRKVLNILTTYLQTC